MNDLETLKRIYIILILIIFLSISILIKIKIICLHDTIFVLLVIERQQKTNQYLY